MLCRAVSRNAVKLRPPAAVHALSMFSAVWPRAAQVERVGADEDLEEKRLVIRADLRGRIRAVSRPDSELFGFRASELQGTSLCDW